jgi:FkbM family methyltransferase
MSQYGQDVFVRDTFFPDLLDGTYVEVGAYDGLALSNTALFERLGWRGVCVEATLEDFERLKVNRPGADCVYGASYDRDGTVVFRRVDGAPRMLSGVAESHDPRHVARIQREGGSLAEVVVPCHRLDGLLAARGIARVNYMSVDVEGGEAAVLRGLGAAAAGVDVMTIEDNYGQAALFDEILRDTHERREASLGCDLLYVRRGFA